MSDMDLACQALFSGRMNVPTAAKACGLTTEEMKREFLRYVSATAKSDWELDTVPCWPYA